MGILSKLFWAKATEVKEDINVYTDILDRSELVNNFFIAGLAHHCSRNDVGFFTGVVFNEKDNAYSSRAMAVGNNQTKKIMGYVPESILDNYRRWCKAKHVCIGYVFFDGEHLRGRVRAYHPDVDKDDMMKDIAEYARQACEHFGWPVPTFDAE